MKVFPLILLMSVMVSCGGNTSTVSDAGVGIEVSVPQALSNARLVFVGADGIYVKNLAEEKAQRLVEGGAWPRWSPEGDFFVYVKGNEIRKYDLASKADVKIADVNDGRAVAVPPNGQAVWFTEGDELKSVDLASGDLKTLMSDRKIYELDIGPQSESLVATVKDFGYRIWVFHLPTNDIIKLGKGCSASFSPDGKWVTNNLHGHEELALLDARSGEQNKTLPAPTGTTTDNQFWSNDSDWIVSMQEDTGYIFAHRVSDGASFCITNVPGGDRPDLFVPQGADK